MIVAEGGIGASSAEEAVAVDARHPHVLAGVGRLDHLAATDVETDVIDRAWVAPVGPEEDQVAPSQVADGDLPALLVLRHAVVRERHAPALPGAHGQPGAVERVGPGRRPTRRACRSGPARRRWRPRRPKTYRQKTRRSLPSASRCRRRCWSHRTRSHRTAGPCPGQRPPRLGGVAARPGVARHAVPAPRARPGPARDLPAGLVPTARRCSGPRPARRSVTSVRRPSPRRLAAAQRACPRPRPSPPRPPLRRRHARQPGAGRAVAGRPRQPRPSGGRTGPADGSRRWSRSPRPGRSGPAGRWRTGMRTARPGRRPRGRRPPRTCPAPVALRRPRAAPLRPCAARRRRPAGPARAGTARRCMPRPPGPPRWRAARSARWQRRAGPRSARRSRRCWRRPTGCARPRAHWGRPGRRRRGRRAVRRSASRPRPALRPSRDRTRHVVRRVEAPVTGPPRVAVVTAAPQENTRHTGAVKGPPTLSRSWKRVPSLPR